MDIGRRPYTTTARFFRDSDDTCEIKWYKTDRALGTLPVPSKIQSLDWSTRPWLASGIGEVYNTPRKFNNAWSVRSRPVQRLCGTLKEISHGTLSVPPKFCCYDNQDIPFCCLMEPPPTVSENQALPTPFLPNVWNTTYTRVLGGAPSFWLRTFIPPGDPLFFSLAAIPPGQEPFGVINWWSTPGPTWFLPHLETFYPTGGAPFCHNLVIGPLYRYQWLQFVFTRVDPCPYSQTWMMGTGFCPVP